MQEPEFSGLRAVTGVLGLCMPQAPELLVLVSARRVMGHLVWTRYFVKRLTGRGLSREQSGLDGPDGPL